MKMLLTYLVIILFFTNKTSIAADINFDLIGLDTVEEIQQDDMLQLMESELNNFTENNNAKSSDSKESHLAELETGKMPEKNAITETTELPTIDQISLTSEVGEVGEVGEVNISEKTETTIKGKEENNSINENGDNTVELYKVNSDYYIENNKQNIDTKNVSNVENDLSKDIIIEDHEIQLELRTGATLQDGIKSWANNKEIRLIWKSNRDFYIESDANYNGDQYQVLDSLARDIQGSNITFRYFKGNNVLIVEEIK